MNSPAGAAPGEQPLPEVEQSESTIGALASRSVVLSPMPAVSVRPKPTRWIIMLSAKPWNVQAAPIGRGVTPVIGVLSTMTATSNVVSQFGYAVTDLTVARTPPVPL